MGKDTDDSKKSLLLNDRNAATNKPKKLRQQNAIGHDHPARTAMLDSLKPSQKIAAERDKKTCPCVIM